MEYNEVLEHFKKIFMITPILRLFSLNTEL
jgi:hypothetical protein